MKLKFYKTGRTEPSMRDEMFRTLNGSFPEMTKKMPVLLRKMRRHSDGTLVLCECVDSVSKEGDKDFFCPICHGEGKKWDEKYMNVYKVVIRSDLGIATKEHIFDPGIIHTQVTTFYTTYDQPITEEDKVVELVLDSEGKIIRPVKRFKLHRIVSVIDFRADNGRVEYLKIGSFEEDYKFLNG